MLASMHVTTGTAEATPADLPFGEPFVDDSLRGEFLFPFLLGLFRGEFFGDLCRGDCFGEVAGVESFSPFDRRGDCFGDRDDRGDRDGVLGERAGEAFGIFI